MEEVPKLLQPGSKEWRLRRAVVSTFNHQVSNLMPRINLTLDLLDAAVVRHSVMLVGCHEGAITTATIGIRQHRCLVASQETLSLTIYVPVFTTEGTLHVDSRFVGDA